VNAQLEFSTYLDAGKNNVSEGFFLHTAVTGTYCIGKYSIQGGYQANLINPDSKIRSAGSMIVSRQFLLKNSAIKLEGIYMNNRFSEFVREENWAVFLEIQQKHFRIGAGTNIRVYSIPKSAFESLENSSNDRLSEYWNLMYFIGYNVKPVNSKWNLGVNLTNVDRFMINQETNPGFKLDARYNFPHDLTVYTEAWLQRSGAFNLIINQFGYLIRLGVLWYLNI